MCRSCIDSPQNRPINMACDSSLNTLAQPPHSANRHSDCSHSTHKKIACHCTAVELADRYTNPRTPLHAIARSLPTSQAKRTHCTCSLRIHESHTRSMAACAVISTLGPGWPAPLQCTLHTPCTLALACTCSSPVKWPQPQSTDRTERPSPSSSSSFSSGFLVAKPWPINTYSHHDACCRKPEMQTEKQMHWPTHWTTTNEDKWEHQPH